MAAHTSRYGASFMASARAGVSMPGSNPADVARSGDQDAWHPTVAYLAMLVVAEYLSLVIMRYVFRHAHGG